jgi:hypothetical protein
MFKLVAILFIIPLNAPSTMMVAIGHEAAMFPNYAGSPTIVGAYNILDGTLKRIN